MNLGYSVGSTTEGRRSQRDGQHDAGADDRDVERESRVEPVVRRPRERVVRIRERKKGRDDPQPCGHLLARHEQSAEEDLREDDRRHELNRLELRLREGAHEEAEGASEHRIRHGEPDDEPLRAVDLEPEEPEGQDGDGVACTIASSAKAMP